jgi:hypothetical protein
LNLAKASEGLLESNSCRTTPKTVTNNKTDLKFAFYTLLQYRPTMFGVRFSGTVFPDLHYSKPGGRSEYDLFLPEPTLHK